MQEAPNVLELLRSIGAPYWLLGVLLLAAGGHLGRTKKSKAMICACVVALFFILPIYKYLEQYRLLRNVVAARTYFNLKCAEQAGVKIYKKMNGVKSVYALKPLQPASEKDLFDQFWYGDPYSFNAQENRGEAALRAMILKIKASPGDAHGDGLEFAEIALVENGISRFVRLSPSAEPPYFRTIESISKPVSRFALTWEDVSTPKDRAHWVAGSRLRVVDQESGAIVAERIGFLIEPALGSRAGQRRPWLSAKSKSNTCPEAHDWTDRWFVLSVLNSTEEMRHEK